MRRLALLVFAACAADSGTARTTPVATSRAPSATASATTAIVDAGPKDWMWQLVGGSREVHWRWPNGTCELWRVDPDGAPAEYRGTVFRPSDALELQMTYEGGAPPKLRGPRVVEERGNDAGTTRVDLPCAGEETVQWYLDPDSCAAGGAAPLEPRGCFASFAPEARARYAKVLHGELRDALVAAIARARFVWTGCTKRIVRKTGRTLWLNDTYLYPTALKLTANGVALEEEAIQNPDRVAGGDIAIGCCSSARYVVMSIQPGVAELLATGREPNTERWYIDTPPPADTCSKR